MFTKTIISAEYVILTSTFFYEKFVFADKYVILTRSSATPSEAKVVI